jgi:hypothetical protein
MLVSVAGRINVCTVRLAMGHAWSDQPLDAAGSF